MKINHVAYVFPFIVIIEVKKKKKRFNWNPRQTFHSELAKQVQTVFKKYYSYTCLNQVILIHGNKKKKINNHLVLFLFFFFFWFLYLLFCCSCGPQRNINQETNAHPPPKTLRTPWNTVKAIIKKRWKWDEGRTFSAYSKWYARETKQNKVYKPLSTIPVNTVKHGGGGGGSIVLWSWFPSAGTEPQVQPEESMDSSEYQSTLAIKPAGPC